MPHHIARNTIALSLLISFLFHPSGASKLMQVQLQILGLAMTDLYFSKGCYNLLTAGWLYPRRVAV